MPNIFQAFIAAFVIICALCVFIFHEASVDSADSASNVQVSAPFRNNTVYNPSTISQSSDTSTQPLAAAASTAPQRTQDWVIEQVFGNQVLCWTLKSVNLYYGDGTIASDNNINNAKSIYWSNANGTTIEIDGNYDYIEVSGNNFQDAYAQLNTTAENCPSK